jgi:hypothetical protein
LAALVPVRWLRSGAEQTRWWGQAIVLHKSRLRAGDMSSAAATGPPAGREDTGGRVGESARAGMFAPVVLVDRGPLTVPASLAPAWLPPPATAMEGKIRRWAGLSWAA